MHLYFFVRGKFAQVEEWKAHAQAAYWKWRRINPKGKEEMTLVQGALRPSVLGAYEYVFPREALAEVCSFFGIKDHEEYTHSDRFKDKFRLVTLRKIFGAKKIPKKILKEAQGIPKTFMTGEFERGGSNCVIPGVALHAIGIKADDYRKFPETGYSQEAL